MGARDPHGLEAPWGEFRHVGRPQRKVDGLAKATGAAQYTDDLSLPGMLHAKTLRSPHAHARLRAVEAAEARRLPGVLAVITGQDLPVRYGILPWTQDETALAVDRVRFVGDPVAAVAAVDEDTANAALKLLRVDYEPLHAYLDPFESLVRHDPAIHEDRKEGNVSKRVELAFGDVEAALAGADALVEDDYYFHGTTHAAIEPPELPEAGRLRAGRAIGVQRLLGVEPQQARDAGRRRNRPGRAGRVKDRVVRATEELADPDARLVARHSRDDQLAPGRSGLLRHRQHRREDDRAGVEDGAVVDLSLIHISEPTRPY